MSGPFLFGADELVGPDGRQLQGALEAARALEQVADDAPVMIGSAFSDQVMAAIADEPSPVAGGFLMPLRRNGILRGFTESVRQAWVSSGGGRPAFARAMALAYVLVVAIAGVSLAGAATFGAAGALGVLGQRATEQPSTGPTTAPEIKPFVPEESEASDETAEPSESPEASELPEASPDETEGSDDHGGGSEPEASDDHGDHSGSGGDDNAGPSETDSPDASDDHSGSDNGGPSETDDHSGSDDGGSGSGSGSGSGGGSGD